MTKLWLDDARDPREHLPRKYPDVAWSDELFAEWVWVKTKDEAIALLATGTVTEAWFDHDLGEERDPSVGNGLQVLDWLEAETATNPDFQPPAELHVLTGNSTQWDRMDQVIRRIKERPWEGRPSPTTVPNDTDVIRVTPDSYVDDPLENGLP